MDINELKSKVLEQAQESAQLAQTKKQLEKQKLDTMQKNFTEIALPFMKEMNTLVRKISDLSNITANINGISKLYLGPNVPDNYYFRISKYWGGVYTTFGKSSDKYYNAWKTDLVTMGKWSCDYLLNLSYWFLTEEKTQEFVDLAKKFYTDVLEVYSEQIKTRNEQLSQSITELTEELKRASTVEHKEDGTVEIHLGGKTYKATLKEGEGC